MADLTLTGAVFVSSSEAGFGEVLSGAGSYGDAGNLLGGLSSFTVECRVNLPSAQSGTKVVFGQAGIFWLGTISGNIVLNYGSPENAVVVSTGVPFDYGTTNHVAVCLGDSGAKVFKDGVLIGSSATSLSSTSPSPLFNFTVKGNYNGDGQFNFLGTIDELAYFSGERYTAGFTPPTTPYAETEPDIQTLWHLDGNGDDAVAPDLPDTLPSDTAIFYSPYNWKLETESAKTICAGAYFKTIFTGSSCVLFFDLTNNLSPLPELRIVVDGTDYARVPLAQTIRVDAPDVLTNTEHLLEVYVDSTSLEVNRWGSQENQVNFTGFKLNTPSDQLKPTNTRKNKILFYGDSITEGIYTIKSTGGTDVSRHSAFISWAIQVGKNLNSEFGIVGFGAIGVVKGGAGSVPPLNTSWDFMWSGEARDFSEQPNLCVINIGTNDDATITDPTTAMLDDMMSVMTSTKFVVLEPFNGDKSAELEAGTLAAADQGRVRFQSTAGFWDVSESPDGLHPYGYACLAKIAPSVSNAIESDMCDIFTGTPSTANLSITGVPDGDYKTVLFDGSDNEVFRGVVTYASGSASLANFQAVAGTALEGYTIDNESPHENGAVITGVTV